VDICVTSGAKGGTGKTTFAEILAYVWRAVFGLSAGVVRPLDGGSSFEFRVVDFPAFQLTDRPHLKALLRCSGVIYVVDEDYETLHAVEVLHAALRGKALGVVLNKVVGKPGREFLRMYGQLSRIYVAHFDERMAVHKSVGVPPYRIRSVATLEMAKAAMDLKKHLFRPGR
jgi:hypothetical protein